MGGVVLRGAQKIVFRAPQLIVTLDFSLEEVQTFNVLNPSVVAAINGVRDGFAVGTQNGRVILFDATSGVTPTLTDSIDKLVPGTVTSLAHDNKTNRLIVAGRLGIVDGARGGTLASVPLELDEQGRLIFAPARPMETERVFEPGTRPVAFSSNPNGVIFAPSSGPVTWMRWDGPVIYPLNEQRAEVGGQVVALSAFGDTLFVALKTGKGATIFGFDPSGAETFRHDLAWQVEHIDSFRDGVFVSPVVPRGFFNFGSDPVVVALTMDGTERPFPVPGLITAQNRSSVTVDPTGRSILFASTRGAEFRTADSYETSSHCFVKPDPSNPGIPVAAAAFSPDGQEVVLGASNGSLSIWQREGACWERRTNLESSAGWRTTDLAFDGVTVVGRSQSKPTLIRRWDARTGEEVGVAYKFEARALAIEPSSSNGVWGVGFPWSTPRTSTKVTYASPQEYGVFDLSTEALQLRLCATLKNAIESGLVNEAANDHPCKVLGTQ